MSQTPEVPSCGPQPSSIFHWVPSANTKKTSDIKTGWRPEERQFHKKSIRSVKGKTYQRKRQIPSSFGCRALIWESLDWNGINWILHKFLYSPCIETLMEMNHTLPVYTRIQFPKWNSKLVPMLSKSPTTALNGSKSASHLSRFYPGRKGAGTHFHGKLGLGIEYKGSPVLGLKANFNCTN